MKVIDKGYDIKPPYEDSLLLARGVKERDLETFKNPLASTRKLQDPKYLDGVDMVETLLLGHLHEKILLVVDSDMDGFCSATIIYRYIKRLNDKAKIVPFLHSEKQHGLQDVVETIEGDDFGLVIVPDAGSNDDEFFAMFPWTDFLVIDHHEREIPLDDLPSNVLLINPHLSPDYDNKGLSGAAVTWQVCRYLDNSAGTDYADEMIDLAALSIVSDMMPLNNVENMLIVNKGIREINNPFFEALVAQQEYNLRGEVTPTGTAFYLAPVVNAVCRTGSQEDKYMIFMAMTEDRLMVPSKKRGESGVIVSVTTEAVRMGANAKKRQDGKAQAVADSSMERILEYSLDKNKILLVALPKDMDIPNGILGLTAQRISKQFGLPTLFGRIHNGTFKGSGRGVEASDFPPFKSYLLDTGLMTFAQGHENAFGFEMPIENMHLLEDRANEDFEGIEPIRVDSYDVAFSNDKTFEIKEFIEAVDQLRYLWGQQMPEPTIYVHDIYFTKSDVRVMGAKADTVSVVSNGIKYIFFKRTEDEVQQFLSDGVMCLSVVGRVTMNYFNGSYTPQIQPTTYEVKQTSTFFGF